MFMVLSHLCSQVHKTSSNRCPPLLGKHVEQVKALSYIWAPEAGKWSATGWEALTHRRSKGKEWCVLPLLSTLSWGQAHSWYLSAISLPQPFLSVWSRSIPLTLIFSGDDNVFSLLLQQNRAESRYKAYKWWSQTLKITYGPIVSGDSGEEKELSF